jgi:HAMP domain-containing protein
MESLAKLVTAAVILAGAVTALVMRRAHSRRMDRAVRQLEEARTRLDAVRTFRKLERDAETQDDEALVDRLSDRR